MKDYTEQATGPAFDEKLVNTENPKHAWETGPAYDPALANAENPKPVGPGRDADGNPLPENSGVEVVPERKGPGQN